MNDDRLKYGTEFTSVKVHQSPGGNSSLSLAWGTDSRKQQSRPEQMRPAPRDRPEEYDRGARPEYGERREDRREERDPRRGYQEQERGYAGREPEERRYEQPRYEQPRYEQSRYEQPRYEQPRYEQQRDQRPPDRGYEPREERYREEERRPKGPQERSDLRQFQQYGKSQYEDLGYNQQPRYDARGQPQASSNVHTSVKVREPPGGRTNFTFGYSLTGQQLEEELHFQYSVLLQVGAVHSVLHSVGSELRTQGLRVCASGCIWVIWSA